MEMMDVLADIGGRMSTALFAIFMLRLTMNKFSFRVFWMHCVIRASAMRGGEGEDILLRWEGDCCIVPVD